MIHTQGVDFVVILSLTWLVIAVIWILIQLFYVIRPVLPVIVNCWFCNKSTYVSYKTSNSWDCPSCLQYNGFTEDGDYNKDIREQYECVNRSFAVPKLMTQIPHKLCAQCNAVQEQKIKKLATFRPLNPAMYDTELEHFRLTLEHVYSLCPSCEKLVSRIINQKLAKALRMQYNSSPLKCEKAPQKHISSTWPVFCHMLCLTLAVCLGLATWLKVDNRDSEILVVYFMNIFSYKQYITIIPLIVLLLVVIRGSCSVLNVGSLIVWMAIHFLPWLIIKTDMSAYLDIWTQDNFELVLLSAAVFINIIAAMRIHKSILKKVQLTKMHAGSIDSSTSSGKQYSKTTESNIYEHVEMNSMPQSSLTKLTGPKLNNDIANLQLGRKQYFSSHVDQLEDSNKTYNRTSMFRSPILHSPVYGATESIPRPRMSSFVRGYQQVHDRFRVFSLQNDIFPQESNRRPH
ncbi:uncharacterized protein [Anabrus simplex]|uniref:uncharacterized protein isoform X2 n=1 Tax=Anabrus simplex TaxID=316456 RepID=UPI0035A31F2A